MRWFGGRWYERLVDGAVIYIYKLKWETGHFYIGQTTRLKERVWQHKYLNRRKDKNRIKSALYEQYGAPEVEILATTSDHHKANALENCAISEHLRNPLLVNKQTAPQRTHLPKGEVICSVCRESKPTNEYFRDRSRSNGLMSRCRDCDYSLKKAFASGGSQERADTRDALRAGTYRG